MHSYLSVLKKYAVFNGRATRKEYWMFSLFNFLLVIVLGVLAALFAFSNYTAVFSCLYIIYLLYSLGIILPHLAVLVRRLHDIGKSGLWFFISFIPLAGMIWLLILLCTRGTHGPNQYGDDPQSLLN
ncbi:MAG: hypothetical protein K0S30_1904 [Clostridia bacterium]|jgi:uncharacterized membrane protein YhaH (DUF805 family)|nr:hypothetical protein [Clostridia bacterium]